MARSAGLPLAESPPVSAMPKPILIGSAARAVNAPALASTSVTTTAPTRAQVIDRVQGILDFVSFDGIDYLRGAEEPGRPLGWDDLGVEFATVGCSMGEDRRGCPFGVDAAAAFMPAGTRMYAVRGHATDFRLAAVWRDRIFLYQAWRNPRAKVGGKLYDIAGKVRAIDVQRGEPTPAAPGTPLRIASAPDVETLVDMIVHSPVRRPQACFRRAPLLA